MTRLHLVRHGRAAAGWDVDPDPDLDDVGRAQALDVAGSLVESLASSSAASSAPLAVVSSPLLRCRSTAMPLAERWGVEVRIEPRVAEIPSPVGVAMADRVEWLRAAMAGTWDALGDRYLAYRDEVVQALLELPGDTVVFSHFVAINVAIGVASGDDRVVIRRVDNTSVTVIDVVGGRLRLVEGGREADTLIR
jgi:broad specificity phosphatase PhoE